MADSVKNIKANIFVDDKNGKETLRGLTAQSRKLNGQLRNLDVNSEAYQRKVRELRKVRGRIREHQQQVYGVGRSWGQIADKFNRYSSIAIAGFAAVAGAAMSLREVIQSLADKSDLRANVAKTTDMTAEELDRLEARFKEFDTRTSRKELFMLAEEAGKMGERGVESIGDFVEQANELKVALGEDLGEDATLQIGKMADVFDTSIRKMGSGINATADNTKANAGFLTDFAARLAGISKEADIAAGDVLGYGASLDEMGLKVEMSSTALNAFFGDFIKDTEKFGRAAGFSRGELSKLIGEKGTNEGFLAFLERLRETTNGSDEFLRKLDEVGISGSRKSQTFLALSQNVDKLRKNQALANEEIDKGTSLTEEYNKKNNNFAGTVAKIQKKIFQTFIDSSFVDSIKSIVTWFGKLIGAIEDTDGSVTRFRDTAIAVGKALITVTAALVGYKSALLITSRATGQLLIKQRAQAALNAVLAARKRALTGATLLYKGAVLALQGNLTKASQAMRIFNRVTRMNPLGLLLGAVTAVTAAYIAFSKRTDAAAQAQEALNEVQKTAAKRTADERAEVERLLHTARSEVASKEQKRKAIEKLRELAPDYLGDLTQEKINTEETTAAVDAYIASLEKAARVKAAQEKLTELFKQKLEVEQEAIEDQTGSFMDLAEATLASGGNVAIATQQVVGDNLARNENIKKINAQIEALMEHNVELQKTQGISELANRAIQHMTESEESLRHLFRASDYEQSIEGFKAFLQERLEAAQVKQSEIDAVLNPTQEDDGEGVVGPGGLSEEQKEAKRKAAEWLANWRMEQRQAQMSDHEKELEQARANFEVEMEMLREQGLQKTELYAQIKRSRDNTIERLEREHQDQLFAERLASEEQELNSTRRTKAEEQELQEADAQADIELNRRVTTAKKGFLNQMTAAEKEREAQAVGTSMAMATANAFEAESFEEGTKTILNAIRSQIQALLAKAIANIVADSFKKGGVAGLILAPIAGAAAAGLFGSIVPEFSKGGYTGLGRGIPDPELPGRNITGYVHDNEYVVPSELLSRPDVGGMVEDIEQVRQGRMRGFATGGYTGTAGGTTVVNNTTNNTQTADSQELIKEIRAMRQDMINRPAIAVVPDRTRQDLNEQNKLEQIVRQESFRS